MVNPILKTSLVYLFVLHSFYCSVLNPTRPKSTKKILFSEISPYLGLLMSYSSSSTGPLLSPLFGSPNPLPWVSYLGHSDLGTLVLGLVSLTVTLSMCPGFKTSQRTEFFLKLTEIDVTPRKRHKIHPLPLSEYEGLLQHVFSLTAWIENLFYYLLLFNIFLRICFYETVSFLP